MMDQDRFLGQPMPNFLLLLLLGGSEDLVQDARSYK